MLTPLDKESLRHAVREILVTRFPAALTTAAIRRRVETDQILDAKITDEDVIAALMYLNGLNPAQVSFSTDELGTTSYSQATTAGVQAQERSGSLK